MPCRPGLPSLVTLCPPPLPCVVAPSCAGATPAAGPAQGAASLAPRQRAAEPSEAPGQVCAPGRWEAHPCRTGFAATVGLVGGGGVLVARCYRQKHVVRHGGPRRLGGSGSYAGDRGAVLAGSCHASHKRACALSLPCLQAQPLPTAGHIFLQRPLGACLPRRRPCCICSAARRGVGTQDACGLLPAAAAAAGARQRSRCGWHRRRGWPQPWRCGARGLSAKPALVCRDCRMASLASHCVLLDPLPADLAAACSPRLHSCTALITD